MNSYTQQFIEQADDQKVKHLRFRHQNTSVKSLLDRYVKISEEHDALSKIYGDFSTLTAGHGTERQAIKTLADELELEMIIIQEMFENHK